MKCGAILVQRGTYHCWIIPSKTEFPRTLFLAMNAKPVGIQGEPLGESMGNL
ncbi:hypothetical protein BDV96DRAFT_588776, partial [Lophiotrema nucula]